MPQKNTNMEFHIFYKTLVTDNERLRVYSYLGNMDINHNITFSLKSLHGTIS